MIWQYTGFDDVSALAEEVNNPKRTFPIALLLAILVMTAVYLLPTIAGVAAVPDLTRWESGSFSAVAYDLPYCENGWLSFWISLAGGASALSLLNAALSCNARELCASATMEGYPFWDWLSKMDANFKGDACPIRAMMVWAVLTLPFSLFDFTLLVEMSSLLVVFGQFIQIVIFIFPRFECLRGRSAKNAEASSMAPYTAMPIEEDKKEEKEKDTAPGGEEDKEDGDEGGKEVEVREKFVVGGGWYGVVLVTVPVFVVSILMAVVEGWLSLVLCIAMVAGMYLLSAIDWGVRRLIERYREEKERETSPIPVVGE
jgi:amino acid transporter